jgi:tetratricopeptide (TPR) repeat protein
LLQDPAGGRRAELARQAIAMARRIANPETLAEALGAAWVVLHTPDNLEECKAIAEEQLALGKETGDEYLQFEAHDYLARIAWQLGDIATLEQRLTLCREFAYKLRRAGPQWLIAVHRAMRALESGDLTAAEEQLWASLRVGQIAQTWHGRTCRNLQLFVLRRAQGRLAEIDRALAAAADEFYSPLVYRCVLAALHAESGPEPAARQALDELLAEDLATFHVDADWLFSISLLGEVCVVIGDPDSAATVHALLVPYRDRYAVADGMVMLGSVARVVGSTAAVMGEWDAAEEHFEEALAIEERMGAGLWMAHTRHEYARMLLTRHAPGDSDRALDHLDQALAHASEFGLTALREKAGALRLDAQGAASR